MGQYEVAKLITPDASCSVKLPDAVSKGLSFKLDWRSYGLESAT